MKKMPPNITENVVSRPCKTAIEAVLGLILGMKHKARVCTKSLYFHV